MRQPLQHLMTVLALGASLPAWSADYQLVYSETNDRAGSLPLGGAVVAGDLFGRVLPVVGPFDSGIEEVRFYLDGAATVFHDEGSAPYELQGGRASAKPYDTTDLTDGPHTIRTEVELGDGTVMGFETSFLVANTAPPAGNVAPQLQVIGDQALRVGDNRVLDIRATDANGDALTLSVDTVLPGFISFVDNGNGTARLTLAPLEADLGSRNITVSVSDGEFSDSETLAIEVQANLGNSFQLIYSETDDRAGSNPLSSAAVQGDLFARLFPEQGPNGEGVNEVRFYLDGAASPFHDEGSAPYELQGGRAATKPWDSTDLPDGAHSIRTEVELDDGSVVAFDTAFSIANVAPPAGNVAPLLQVIGNQSLRVGDNRVLDIRASDANGDALTISTDALPGFISFVDNGNGTARLTLVPLEADLGSRDVTVSVSDGEFSVSETLSVQVLVDLGGAYQLIYSDTDDRAGSNPLSSAAVQGDLFARLTPEQGPNGEGIDEVRFYLDGAASPFHDEGSAPYELQGGRAATKPWDSTNLPDGAHSIRTEVELDDGTVIDFDTAFNIANTAPPPNVAPVLAAIGAQTIEAGRSLVLNLSASDANGDALTLAADVAAVLPGFASFVDNGNGTATLTLAPAAGDVGDHSFTVSASDGTLQDSETFALAVTAVTPPPPPPAAGEVKISEILASNKTGITDGDGDNEDWIELHNSGGSAVDLSGWCLSDDINTWNLWCLPANTTLNAGEYLTVWASKKDPAPAGQLHAAIKLGKGGEFLALYRADGSLADEFNPAFPEQFDDVGYGRTASGELRYFPTPTPNAANGEGVSDLLAFSESALNLSLEAGSAGGAQVALSALAGGVSSYTLNVDDGGTGWLSATLASGEDGNTADLLDIAVSAAALAAGDYSGSVTASATGYASTVLNVNLTVTAGVVIPGSVQITELLASNKTGLTDGDGDNEDWIELHNPGGETVDLAGWCLSDDPAQWNLWCFPANTQLIGGEYRLVWASKKDPAPVGELHAAIKLGKGGEFLALYRPDGTQAQAFDPAFPQQADDVSYGLNGADQSRYFPEPTPGAANGDGMLDLLAFEAEQLGLSAAAGASVNGQVSLAALGGSVTAYTLTPDDAGAGWLSAAAAGGEDGSTADLIAISANASGLAAGNYSGTITASATGHADAQISVNFTVTGDGVVLPTVEISEFLASNDTILADGDGDFEDWIELHNKGAEAVDLEGWCLTDDPDDLAAWCFGPGTTLAADGYLLVWASKKDPAPIGQIHIGLKLSAGGEYLALVRPDGSIAHEYAPTFPEQFVDTAYGVDAEGNEVMYVSPTPGAENGSGGGVVSTAPVTLSVERGFYDAPFSVTVSGDASVELLRYTTDGSEPTASNGSDYSSPISVDTTTVLRVAGFAAGERVGRVQSHSYLFLADVIEQPENIDGYPNPKQNAGPSTTTHHDYEMDPRIVSDYSDEIIDGMRAIPTMSMSLSKELLWDEEVGFYLTDDIEAAASVEVLYADDPEGNHQVNAGLEGHSHIRIKRSMRLNFRAEYGDSKFNSDLLDRAPLNGASASGRYDKIMLRAGNNRSWARAFNEDRTAYTIDQFIRDTQIAASGAGARGTFVHLYINGLYWGLYNATERADKHFLSDYFGGDKADWFSTNHGLEYDEGGTHLSGDKARYDYLTRTLIHKDMDDSANYAELQEYLDVERFIDYLLVNWWAANADWPANNYYAGSRNDSSPEGTTGLMYFSWDSEWTFDRPYNFGNSNGQARIWSVFHSNQSVNSVGDDKIIAKLWHAARDNSDFMALVKQRALALTGSGGALNDDVARQRWATLNNFVRSAVIGESARWGDTVSSPPRNRDDDWQSTVDFMDGVLDGNADELLGELSAQGYLD